MADLPDDVLKLMTNRRGDAAPLLLLHGALSDGRGWYPIVDVVFAPFFTVSTPTYPHLREWADVIRHWAGSDEDRERTIRGMRDVLLEQLRQVLRATAPDWTGPRPHVIAHSYGTILVYRYLEAHADAHTERILFRGCPLSPALPFDSWNQRAGPVENIAGGEDLVLDVAERLGKAGGWLTSDSRTPPHPGGFGSAASGPAGLGTGHVVDVDPHRAEDWSCGNCSASAAWVHTWRVPLLNHTDVSPSDVRTFWFPLVLGWEPAIWHHYVQSVNRLARGTERNDEALDAWLNDSRLSPLWRPYTTAAGAIRAEVSVLLDSDDLYTRFWDDVPRFERAIGLTFVKQASAALSEWHRRSSQEHSSRSSRTPVRPPNADVCGALLPEALATLTRDLVTRWRARQP